MSIGAVVLAAGQGTRMRSALPKVLHRDRRAPDDRMGARRPRRAAASTTPWWSSVTAPRRCAGCCPRGARRRCRREQLGTGHAAQIGLARPRPRLRHGDRRCAATRRCCPPSWSRGWSPSRRRREPGAATMRHRGRSTTPAPTVGSSRGADGTVDRVVEARDASAPTSWPSTRSTPASTSSTGRALAARARRPRLATTPRARSTCPTCSPRLDGTGRRAGRADPDVVAGRQRPRGAGRLRGDPAGAAARAS